MGSELAEIYSDNPKSINVMDRGLSDPVSCRLPLLILCTLIHSVHSCISGVCSNPQWPVARGGPVDFPSLASCSTFRP